MAVGSSFVRVWAGSADPDTVEAVDAAMSRLITAGREHHPAIALDAEAVTRFVADRISSDVEPLAELARFRAADVVVAVGCMERDPAAIEVFRDAVANVIRSVLAAGDPSAADDVFQILFCRLFLAEAGNEPKISGYDGRRELGPWVRTLARNGAIDHLRRLRPMSPLEHGHIERVGEMLDDQERSYLRDTCWAEFKGALADAFAQLEPRQRNVLRCHLKGLNAERIGRMYGVHRVTVARWLGAIRFELLEATRAGLRERLGGDEAGVDSIVRMVDMDLTASLTRLVGTTTP